MRPPDDCNSMTELREEIDALDERLVDLLAQRAGYIDRAVTLKQREGLPARITDRVEEVLANVRAKAEARDLDGDLAARLWREVIEWSITHEERVLGRDNGKEPRE